MAYESDRLYNEVIRKMMSQLASKVKVRDIVPQLPCLTLTDREEIEAKRETAGNYTAMTVLLDNLRRRENWPDEFITALRAAEHKSLSNEIQNAYDRMRGINPKRETLASQPAVSSVGSADTAVLPPAQIITTASTISAPSTVVTSTKITATIHSAPQPLPALVTPPPMQEPAQLPDLPHVESPLESHPKTNASVGDEALTSGVHPPTEPASEPEPVLASQARLPINVPKVSLSHEPSKVSVSPAATPTLGISDNMTLTLQSPTCPASLPANSTNTLPSQSASPCMTSQPPAIPEDSQVAVTATESLISVKHPIQDTRPPGKVDISAESPKINSNVNQLVEKVDTSSTTCPVRAVSPETVPVSDNVVAGPMSQTDAENEYFSKPGTLEVSQEEPCSVVSDDLEISTATTGTVSSSPVQPTSLAPVSNLLCIGQHVKEPHPVRTNDLTIMSSAMQPVQNTFHETISFSMAETPKEPVSVSNAVENSFPVEVAHSSPNQPVEDHYESFCPSVSSDQGTLVNIVQVFEEPSIQNLNGQPASITRNLVHSINEPLSLSLRSQTGSQPDIYEESNMQNMQEIYGREQAGPDIDSSVCVEPTTSAGTNNSGLINTCQSKQQKEPEGVLAQVQHQRLIVAAAAIGVSAIFMAWKFKH